MPDTREARAWASEIKFVVDLERGAAIRDWARTHLEADPHGLGTYRDEYRITSLYFDTARHDVFHRRGSFARAKYRVRRYTESDFVFLERKLRKPELLVKRRTQAPIEVLKQLAGPEPDSEGPAYWFHRRLLVRGLRPVCQVAYQRMARTISVNGAAGRLTLDESVAASPIAEAHFNGDQGRPIFTRQLILELKFRGAPPSIFKRLVEEFRLSPQTASKYRLGMVALGHPPQDQPILSGKTLGV